MISQLVLQPTRGAIRTVTLFFAQNLFKGQHEWRAVEQENIRSLVREPEGEQTTTGTTCAITEEAKRGENLRAALFGGTKLCEKDIFVL